MKRNKFNGLRIWSGNITFCLMVAVLHFLSPSLGQADAPEHSVVEGGVQLRGVGTQNPIIYDNDWWFDVFDNNYLWAQTSLGNTDLRDMWEWQKGYHYTMEQSVKDAKKALILAKDSGLGNVPNLTLGSDRSLERPANGRIEDTRSYPTDGSRLIVEEARMASPDKPLLVIAGSPLTTVANALLTNPEIAPNLVVFGLTVTGAYNGKDGLYGSSQ